MQRGDVIRGQQANKGTRRALANYIVQVLRVICSEHRD